MNCTEDVDEDFAKDFTVVFLTALLLVVDEALVAFADFNFIVLKRLSNTGKSVSKYVGST